MTKIAFFGAAGKMGKRLVALAAADPELQIVAALEAPTCPELGRDAGEVAGIAKIGVPLAAELPADVQPDVIVDFSSPRALDALLALCLDRKIALVYATTGADADQLQRLEDASKTIPVLRSPSMSPSVNLAMKLTQIAAKALKDQDADVEILERHHRYKVDAPSGTALKFGSLIAAEMGIDSFRDGRGDRLRYARRNPRGYRSRLESRRLRDRSPRRRQVPRGATGGSTLRYERRFATVINFRLISTSLAELNRANRATVND